MDLYFHRTPSPKQQRQKTFLGDKLVHSTIIWKNQILEKKPFLVHSNNSSVAPEINQKIIHQQHHLVDYIQQQKITVTNQAKKLWKQWHSNHQLSLLSSKNNSIKGENTGSQCSSILLFDSSEHETPSTLSLQTDDNKRSFTDPSLTQHDEEEEEGEEKKMPLLKDYRLLTRALPRLPFSSSSGPISLIGHPLKKKATITRATTWVGRSIQKWITTEEQRKMAILLDDSELEDSMLDEHMP
jgi:hypothetical protein